MVRNQDLRRNPSLFAAAAVAAWLNLLTAQARTGPFITQQPASQAAGLGTNVILSVTAAGTGPLFYQWQFNGSNLPATITTVAGNGANAYSGDGGPAIHAALGSPNGVAVDGLGNLYIADLGTEVVRSVDSNGIIRTVAGNGKIASSGDGGAATNAGMNPASVALDASGNIYIADYAGSRIRKVGSNGVISTVAGQGTNGYSGDGGAATNARLYSPAAVAVDALSNLYIADFKNDRVRKVGADGVITTFAGNGAGAPGAGAYSGDGGPATNASLWGPAGLAFDASGNLYIADSLNSCVRKVSTNGIITTAAGNSVSGPITNGVAATNGALGVPKGVAVDALGNLFIADASNQCILEVSASGLITTVAGIDTNGFSGDGGAATDAQLNNPTDVSVDAFGSLFIADSANSRVRKVTAPAPILTVPGFTASNAGSYVVVVASPSGSVTSSVAVLSVGLPPGVSSQTGRVTAVVGSNVTLSAAATGSGPFFYQWQFDGTNLPAIITTVAGNGQDGESGDGGQATNAQLYAGAVAADTAGNFFIADSANDRVREVNASGVISTIAGGGNDGFSGDGGAATNASLFNPAAVTVDGSGNLYIADEANERIRQVGYNGVISTVAGNGTNGYSGDGGAATNASLSSPSGVAVDAWGNLYIADEGNNRIRQVGVNGVILTVAGNGTNGFSGDGGPAVNASLSSPADVAVDALGNVFIADSGNIRIRKVSMGVITTVAGHGYAGYYGDGGPATNAILEAPASVAVDASGNLFIADGTEHVREVSVGGIISTVAGNAGLGYSGDGGPATNARLSEVYGVATDVSGDLLIADTGANVIRKVTAFGPDLPIDSFGFAQDGAYDLIVSTPFGRTNSAVIVVTAGLPPLNARLLGGNAVQLQFTGTPGSSYVVQTTTNLTAPVVWAPLATNAAGLDGRGTFTDTNLSSNPVRFYRLELP